MGPQETPYGCYESRATASAQELPMPPQGGLETPFLYLYPDANISWVGFFVQWMNSSECSLEGYRVIGLSLTRLRRMFAA